MSPSPAAQPGRGALAAATLLGFVVSATLVWLAAQRVDLAQVRSALVALRWWPWVPLAVSSYLLGHLVRGYRCSRLLAGQANLGTFAASNVVIAGYASNNVLPARLGEFVRAGILSARTGLPVWQSLSVTLLERVVDGIAILMLLTLASINTAPSAWLTALTRGASLVLGLAASVLLLAVVWPSLPVSLASRIGGKLGNRSHDVLVRLASQFTAALKNLRSPRLGASFLLASLAVWTLEAGMFVALMPALGLEGDFWRGALVMGVTNLGLLAPSTPGFVGTFHAFCSQALVGQGVDPSLAVSFAVAAHLTFFVPVTLWGAVALLVSGVKLGSTIGLVRAARSAQQSRVINGVEVHVISAEPSSRAPAAPSPFMKSLVEAVVAQSDRPEEVDGRALVAATEFTVGQLAALGALLRAAFAVGMVMFRTWVVVRYLGRFETLPLVRRRRAAESWAYGRFGLFRMLFKPVRGVALLAYFERREIR